MAVLYRCKAPTNRACRCGKVARRLDALGIDYAEVRVAYRRRDRDEVIELTGQDHVPVLVIGDEVVHDSHRILEHLDRLAVRRGAA
jgi:glutathione S-transferase